MDLKELVEYIETTREFVKKVQSSLNSYKNEKVIRLFVSFYEETKRVLEYDFTSKEFVKSFGTKLKEASKEKNTIAFLIEIYDKKINPITALTSGLHLDDFLNKKTKSVSLEKLSNIASFSHPILQHIFQIAGTSSTLRIFSRHIRALGIFDLEKYYNEADIKNPEDAYTFYNEYSFTSNLDVKEVLMPKDNLINLIELDDDSFKLYRMLV
jgi:hypothetical protein